MRLPSRGKKWRKEENVKGEKGLGEKEGARALYGKVTDRENKNKSKNR